MKEIKLKDKGLDSGWVLELFSEDSRQIQKWGYQIHSPFAWLAFATEELGELSEAMSEYIYRGGSKEDIIKEAIQVATLALKIAKMVDELKESK